MNLSQLRLVYYPDPRLRKRSSPIETIDQRLADVVSRMFEIMYEAKGLGLAAVQAGLNWRLFVTNTTGQPDGQRVYINPEILQMEGTVERDEGCLSFPDLYAPLTRAQYCKIRAIDLTGSAFEEEATDLLARAWQHEMDHLNGVLICDRMSPAHKIASRRQLKHLEEKYGTGPATSGSRRGPVARKR